MCSTGGHSSFGIFCIVYYPSCPRFSGSAPLLVPVRLWGLLASFSRDTGGDVGGHQCLSLRVGSPPQVSAGTVVSSLPLNSWRTYLVLRVRWMCVIWCRPFKALDRHWWRQREIFHRYIEYPHLPWAGPGSRGESHSSDVSHYTQVRDIRYISFHCPLHQWGTDH